MDLETVQLLLPLVNDNQIMEALTAYVKHRENVLLDNLKSSASDRTDHNIQGAFKELARLSTLRQEVIKFKDQINAARDTPRST